MDAEHSECRASRRVWCETLPYGELGSARVLGLLRRFGVRPLVAVRPWDLDALPDLAARARGEGVALGLWPMLSDAEGRWLSEATAPAFGELCERALDAAARAGKPPVELALDLEPPFELTRILLGRSGSGGARLGSLALLTSRVASRAARPRARRSRKGEGVRRLADRLAARLAETGGSLSGAYVPLVLLDEPLESAESAKGGSWQALLGTPVDGLPLGHASAMLYTTLVGYAGFLLGRREALELLGHFARLASARFGTRAGISLGAVGTGALGDEPVYAGPAELAEDVAVAEASGISALSLLDLGGVLARPPAEAWLEAFVGGAPPAFDAPGGVERFGFGPGVRAAPDSDRGWRTEVVLRALRTVGPVTRWLAG